MTPYLKKYKFFTSLFLLLQIKASRMLECRCGNLGEWNLSVLKI